LITLSPTTLSDVTRNTTFNNVITITPEEGETINAISVTPSAIDTHVTITTSVLNSRVTISGMYVSGFHDNAKYVSKGSSDLLETPTIVNSLDALPPNKDLFEFNQDGTPSISIDYVINVKYDSEVIDTKTISQTVRNSTSLGYNILRSYFGS
jgi:hypothetical protein